MYGDRIENKKMIFIYFNVPKTDSICELLDIEKGKFNKYFTFDDYIATRIKDTVLIIMKVSYMIYK